MNGNMIQLLALLEESGKEALNKATREAFGNAAEFGAKSILNDLISDHLSQSIRTFVSKFAQAFLQIFYGTEEKTRQIEGVVSTPIREPLLTGLEQLRMANKTVLFSEKSKQFRIERLRNALYSLDRARSLASEEFEIALIDILRGLCAFEIPGGTSEAIVHLTAFKIWAHKETDYFVSIRKKKQRKAERLDVNIEDLKYLLDLKPDNGPLNLALQRAEYSAQCLRAEIEEVTLLEGKVLDTLFFITALLEVAQKIVNEEP